MMPMGTSTSPAALRTGGCTGGVLGAGLGGYWGGGGWGGGYWGGRGGAAAGVLFWEDFIVKKGGKKEDN